MPGELPGFQHNSTQMVAPCDRSYHEHGPTRGDGRAWDAQRQHLLVADLQENRARLVDPQTGEVIAQVQLPRRPRWAVYHQGSGHLLVNIRDPVCVAVLSVYPFALVERYPIASPGPHGLVLDRTGRRAFVACDGGAVITLDLASGRELTQVPIAGTPMPSGTITVWIGSTRPSRTRV